MKELLSWVAANPELALTGAVTAASIIVKITPTETDNRVFGAVLGFLEKVAMNNKPVKVKK